MKPLVISFRNKLFLFLFFIPQLVLPNSALYFKSKGDDSFSQRQYIEAIEFYKRSLKQNPHFVPSLLQIGKALDLVDSREQALVYLLKAFKIEPENPDIIAELAQLYLKSGNIESARQMLNSSLKNFPQRPDLNLYMARVYIAERKIYLAKRKLDRILKSDPTFFEAYIELSKLLLHENNFSAASEALEKARVIQPENPELLVDIAKVKLTQLSYELGGKLYESEIDLGLFADVESFALNAKEYDATNIQANMFLARLFALSGRCSDSISYLKGVLNTRKEHYVARYYWGYCDQSKSIDIYKQLLTEHSNDDLVRFALEDSLVSKYRGRPNQYVLKLAQEHYTTAEALIKKDRQEQAVFEFQRSLYLYPEFIKSNAALLKIYRVSNDLPKMQRQLKLLKRLSKDSIYEDMHEQLIRLRRAKPYFKEGISDPEKLRTPTLVYLFDFKPNGMLTDYPAAGRFSSEALAFALKSTGKVRIFDGPPVIGQSKLFGGGHYYTPETAQNVLTLSKNQLQYVIQGWYTEITDGLIIKVRLTNIVDGSSILEAESRSTGKGYLRRISINLAHQLAKKIPVKGKVIKVKPNQILINLGEQDGISLGSRLQLMRHGERMADIKLSKIDQYVSWGSIGVSADMIQLGDDVIELKK